MGRLLRVADCEELGGGLITGEGMIDKLGECGSEID